MGRVIAQTHNPVAQGGGIYSGGTSAPTGSNIYLLNNSFGAADGYTVEGDETVYGVNGNFAFGGGSGASNSAPDFVGVYTEVLAAAKNPTSPGQYGSRSYISDQSANRMTSPHRFNPSSPLTEFWMRWYSRYELGFDWGGSVGPGYHKLIYCKTASGGYLIIEPSTVTLGGDWGFATPVGTSQRDGTYNWPDFFGATSDGLFHRFDTHVKMDTDSTDGAFQLWIDGTVVVNLTGIDISGGNAGMRAGFDRLDFIENQSLPAHTGIKYLDTDDVAIMNTTPVDIEPITGLPWIGAVA